MTKRHSGKITGFFGTALPTTGTHLVSVSPCCHGVNEHVGFSVPTDVFMLPHNTFLLAWNNAN